MGGGGGKSGGILGGKRGGSGRQQRVYDTDFGRVDLTGRGGAAESIMEQMFKAGESGKKWRDIQGDERLMGYHDIALDAWKAGQQARQQAAASAPSAGGGAIKIGSIGGGGGASSVGGPSYEEQLEKQRKEQERLAEEQRQAEGRRQRDTLYQQRMDAAGSATDFINTQIKQESDRARLLGLDYSISDEDRATRINDYFATVWGAGSESKLGDLMKEFGTPQGFKGFTVTRGTGGDTGGALGQEEVVGTTGGVRPQPTALTDEEDILGGVATALG